MQLTQTSSPTQPRTTWHADPSALVDRRTLIERTMGLVHSLAVEILRVHRPPMQREDLVSCGMRGLVKAADAFDSRRGVRFNTYAYYRIRGSMLDGIRSGHGHSTRAEMNRMIERASGARSHLDDGAQGQGPSSCHGEPLQSLTVMLEDVANSLLGSRASVGDSETLTPEDVVDRLLVHERVRRAIAGLSPRERQVVELLYYHHDNSFEAVAKVLGVTRPHIFRIHARAVARLRDELSELAAH